MRRARLIIFATALLSVASGTPALGAEDVNAPILKASRHPAFVIGGAPLASAATLDTYYGDIAFPAKFHWTTEGGSFCRITISRLLNSDEPQVVATYTPGGIKGALYAYIDNYAGEQGGDSQRTSGWQIDAGDCNAVTSSWIVSAASAIMDDTDGMQASGSAGFLGSPVFTGNWRAMSDSDLPSDKFVGRSVHRSSTHGDFVSVDVDVDAGAHFAVVAPLTTTGGIADLQLDGKTVETIDLSAASRMSTRVVSDVRLAAGAHTITLVNTGSADQRLNVDAFLLADGVVNSRTLPGPVG